MSEWNPNMDEAPRDGSVILGRFESVFVPGAFPHGSWGVSMIWWTGHDDWGWDWAVSDDDLDGAEPIAWMPLPAPSKDER